MRAWRRISSASSANTSKEIGCIGDPLQQPLRELLVVGQPGLPHQRRVRREPAIRGSAARARIPSRSAPSAKILTSRTSSICGPTLQRSLVDDRAGSGRRGEVGRRAGRRARRCRALVRAARMLDRARSGSRPPRRRRVAVGVADHPRGARDRCRARRAASSSMPGRGLAAVARPAQPGDDAVGMVQADAEVVEARRPRRASSSRTRSLDRLELRERDRPLGGRRLVGDAHEQVAGRRRRAQRVGGAGDQRDIVRRAAATPACPVSGSGTSSLITPSRSTNTAAAAAHRRAGPRSSDSQWPCWAASSGCETSACQTTAWKDSTSGVFRSGGASITIATSASWASVPSGRADDAVDRALRARVPARSR